MPKRTRGPEHPAGGFLINPLSKLVARPTRSRVLSPRRRQARCSPTIDGCLVNRLDWQRAPRTARRAGRSRSNFAEQAYQAQQQDHHPGRAYGTLTPRWPASSDHGRRRGGALRRASPHNEDEHSRQGRAGRRHCVRCSAPATLIPSDRRGRAAGSAWRLSLCRIWTSAWSAIQGHPRGRRSGAALHRRLYLCCRQADAPIAPFRARGRVRHRGMGEKQHRGVAAKRSTCPPIFSGLGGSRMVDAGWQRARACSRSARLLDRHVPWICWFARAMSATSALLGVATALDWFLLVERRACASSTCW